MPSTLQSTMSLLTDAATPTLALSDEGLVWVCIGVAIWLLIAAGSKGEECCGKNRRSVASPIAPPQSNAELRRFAGNLRSHRRCRHCQVAHPRVAKFCRQCGQSL